MLAPPVLNGSKWTRARIKRMPPPWLALPIGVAFHPLVTTATATATATITTDNYHNHNHNHGDNCDCDCYYYRDSVFVADAHGLRRVALTGAMAGVPVTLVQTADVSHSHSQRQQQQKGTEVSSLLSRPTQLLILAVKDHDDHTHDSSSSSSSHRGSDAHGSGSGVGGCVAVVVERGTTRPCITIIKLPPPPPPLLLPPRSATTVH